MGNLWVGRGGGSTASLNGELRGILKVEMVGGCPGQHALSIRMPIDTLQLPHGSSPGSSTGILLNGNCGRAVGWAIGRDLAGGGRWHSLHR